MYFSQLVSTMMNPVIQVAVVEDGGAIENGTISRWLTSRRCMRKKSRNRFCGLRLIMREERRNETD